MAGQPVRVAVIGLGFGACPSSPWGTKEAGRSMEPGAMDVEVRSDAGETLRSSANFEVATVQR
jgi:hypothetical protein